MSGHREELDSEDEEKQRSSLLVRVEIRGPHVTTKQVHCAIRDALTSTNNFSNPF